MAKSRIPPQKIVTIRLPQQTIDRLRDLVDPDLPFAADVHRAALVRGLDAIAKDRHKAQLARDGLVVVSMRFAKAATELARKAGLPEPATAAVQ